MIVDESDHVEKGLSYGEYRKNKYTHTGGCLGNIFEEREYAYQHGYTLIRISFP